MKQPQASTVFVPEKPFGMMQINADGSARGHTVQWFATDSDRWAYIELHHIDYYVYLAHPLCPPMSEAKS